MLNSVLDFNDKCVLKKVNYPIQVTILTSKPYKHKNDSKTWVTLTKNIIIISHIIYIIIRYNINYIDYIDI